MKRITRYFSLVLVFASITLNVYTQTPPRGKRISQQDSRATNIKPYYAQMVSWWDSGSGFICKVTADNQSFMTRYDQHGAYVETLVEKPWNENSELWSAFHRSPYRLLKVVSYWEVWDDGKEGYYLEMVDNRNQVSSIWADGSGNFSTIPANKQKK